MNRRVGSTTPPTFPFGMLSASSNAEVFRFSTRAFAFPCTVGSFLTPAVVGLTWPKNMYNTILATSEIMINYANFPFVMK